MWSTVWEAVSQAYVSYYRARREFTYLGETPPIPAYVDPFQSWAQQIMKEQEELDNLTGLS